MSRGQITFVCYAFGKDAERSRTEAELKMAKQELLSGANHAANQQVGVVSVTTPKSVDGVRDGG